jgi:hypothetical protein
LSFRARSSDRDADRPLSGVIHENTTVARLTTGLDNFASFPIRNHAHQPIKSQGQQLSS